MLAGAAGRRVERAATAGLVLGATPLAFEARAADLGLRRVTPPLPPASTTPATTPASTNAAIAIEAARSFDEDMVFPFRIPVAGVLLGMQVVR